MLNKAEDDGFLIDLDLAIKLDREEPSGVKTRVGTKAFMSPGALFGEKHTFLDDLESFFWGFFWICIHCQGPGKVPYRKLARYEQWNYAEPAVLANQKTGEMSNFKREEKPYTEYCRPLVPCLEKLRKAIFPGRGEEKIEDERLYCSMISILTEARDEIKAGSVG